MHKLTQTDSTVDDLIAQHGDERAELINGAIHMMAPAAAKHSLASIRLSAKLDKYFEDKQEKNPQDPDAWIILPEAWTDYGTYNSFVHDIAGFSLKDLQQAPETGPIKAKPLWVCEVLSPSNWSNDTEHKRVVLERHKIRFYWLVDPSRKAIQVFELKDDSEHYQIIKSVDDKDGIVSLPPFAGLDLDLARIFNY